MTTGSLSRTFGLSGALLFYDLGCRLSLSRLLLPDRRVRSSLLFRVMCECGFVLCVLAVLRLLIRSLFLSIVVGIPYIFFYSRKSKATPVIVCFLCLLALLVAMLPFEVFARFPGLQPYVERFGSIFTLVKTTSGELNNILLRLEDLQIAWRGLSGGVELVFGKGLSAPVDIRYSFGVVKEGYHNGFARVLFNAGLVGILAYVLVHASIVLTTHNALARVDVDDRWMLVGLTSWFASAPVYFFGFGGVLGQGRSGNFLMGAVILGMLLKAYAVFSPRFSAAHRGAEN